jgi:hypothetical protein
MKFLKLQEFTAAARYCMTNVPPVSIVFQTRSKIWGLTSAMTSLILFHRLSTVDGKSGWYTLFLHIPTGRNPETLSPENGVALKLVCLNEPSDLQSGCWEIFAHRLWKLAGAPFCWKTAHSCEITSPVLGIRPFYSVSRKAFPIIASSTKGKVPYTFVSPIPQ